MKLFHQQFFLLFFLFVVYRSYSQTQQVKFIPVTGTNGIILGKINGMTRDKYGFMWFSDQSNRCIIRFDGTHMTRYQNDPRNPNSLGGYYPECLFADSNGYIWIGFYGMGLDKFDPVTKNFTHYRHQNNDPGSLSNDSVTAIVIDHFGNIWIGNYGGVDLLDEKTGKFKHYRNDPNDSTSLSYNLVRAMYEDKAGDLWVGTGFPWDHDNKGGLNRLNRKTGKFTRYLSDPKNPQTLINNKVRAIFEDSYGNFWVGTLGDGLHTLDRKTGLFTRHTYNKSHPEQLSRPPLVDSTDHITFITEDADKKIWIGSLFNGLTRYDPRSKEITHYGNKYDHAGILKDSTSWWASATPDGFVWLSTQNSNLFKIDIYNTVIPNYASSEVNGVSSFSETPDSAFWYGTANGLVRFDLKTGSVKRFIHDPRNPNSISDNLVYRIVKDRTGNFWIGTRHGLNHFNIKTENFIRYYHDKNNLSSLSNLVFSLCADGDSILWIGTVSGGLDKLDLRTQKLINYSNNPADLNTISNNVITALLVDEKTGIWIGTDNNAGLNKLNPQNGKFTHYLPGLVINCIYRDESGKIWVGSKGGLFIYDQKKDSFNTYAEDNPGDNIVEVESIAGDKDDNLWIATETGIYMLNKGRDQIFRYGKESGIADANNSFYQGASYTLNDGKILFGHPGGFYGFYPEKLKMAPAKTQLYLTRFWLDNKEIIPGKTELLQKSLYDTSELRLSHDENVFSFTPTIVDFRNSGDNKIFYKLENFDKDWHTASSEEKIQYFKVPSGKYTFRIKTANRSNGEWIEKRMDIIISPPWWNTWWAYIIYALLFIAAAISIHRYQKNRLIREERERFRIKELAQAKEIEKAYHELQVTQSQLIQSEKMASLGELTAGVAHEIQNPLNFVNNFSEVNSELIADMNQEIDAGNFKEVKTIAKNIEENEQKIMFHGKRADAIVKGMLQHSRASSGVKEPTDINALADEYTRLAYHGLRAKEKLFNATVKTDFDGTIGNINVIPQDIGRVILNLITNAFYVVTEKKKEALNGYEPTVSISTKKKNERTGGSAGQGIVEIIVKDNGNGIPQKVMDKIFQPFFTTKPTGQGTGLGLSLSYDIIKAHGGEINVKTKEGEGSEFIIQLPTI